MKEPQLVRAENLRRLIDRRYDGNITAFARESGVNATYTSNMLSVLRGKKSAKPFTAGMAERIEKAIKLAPGELSRDPDQPAGSDEMSNRDLLEALLASIKSQTAALAEARRTLEQLRSAERARQAVFELFCATISARDPASRPLLARTLRESSLQVGVEGSAEFREQAGSLAAYLAELPPTLEDAARLAPLRAELSRDARLA